jgi:hypothetical protein
MFLAVHVPMFGSPNVDAIQIYCPRCPKATNDWVDVPIETCSPGDRFACARCGHQVMMNWGLVEPDHLSIWLSSEHCLHRLCRIKYAELVEANGWAGGAPSKGKRS